MGGCRKCYFSRSGPPVEHFPDGLAQSWAQRSGFVIGSDPLTIHTVRRLFGAWSGRLQRRTLRRGGETIRFMVSCEQPRYESRLVSTRARDTNPAGPGFRQVEIPSSIDGARPGKLERIRPGSFADLACPASAPPAGSASPYRPALESGSARADHRQPASPYEGGGWAIALTATALSR